MCEPPAVAGQEKRQRTDVNGSTVAQVKVKFLPGDEPVESSASEFRCIGTAADKRAARDSLEAYWKGVLQKHRLPHSQEQLEIEGEIKEPSDSEWWEITLKGCSTGHLDELAFESLLPKQALREWLEMLVDQKQLVFFGAPGCSKTYLARRLAMWLLQRERRLYDLVQFSKGYAYEDFVQGLRAKADAEAIQATIDETEEKVGAIADKLKLEIAAHDTPKNKGVLSAAAAAAAQVIGTSKTFQAEAGPLVRLSKKTVADCGTTPDPGSDLEQLLKTLGAGNGQLKVLVIDEMNRAEMSDVFGECFFLLENRGASVTLRYSTGDDEPFYLDKNLLIIGTMNSTDRNIDKQMDVAFVQRFSWAELAPEEMPVRGLLPAYLYSLEKDGVAGAADAATWLPGLVDAWNGVLASAEEGKAEFAIGPRFFLKRALYKAEPGNDVAQAIIQLWRG